MIRATLTLVFSKAAALSYLSSVRRVFFFRMQASPFETTAPTGRRELARKVTAVGTVGQMGQLFTVYEKNWICSDCNQENYASIKKCFRCKRNKPLADANNFVDNPAIAAIQNGEEIAWKEVVDPTTYQVYYYNIKTNATQWERPIEMGPAPFATGWFGRGQAGSNAAQMYAAKNAKYLARPARKQKDFIDPKKYHLEGANEYNIWYGKYLGDHWDNKADKEPATDRCVVESDAGYTKADGPNPGEPKPSQPNGRPKDKRFFCLHFARGMCAKGKDCIFYHRIPTPQDDAHTDELFDCFGRSRHAKHRDDMNGVGSFMKPCRTLYVANLLKSKYNTPKELDEALTLHFSEWGEVENVNVIHRLSIAFIRYRLRTSSEFAKEAMTNQALDHEEILSIRWAYDDPNPVAQDAIRRADQDAIYSILKAKGVNMEETSFKTPSTYQPPSAKRIKLEDGTDVLQDLPELAYPDTDAQYDLQQQSAASAYAIAQRQSGMSADQYAAYCAHYYANYSSSAEAAPPDMGAESDIAVASASAATDIGDSENRGNEFEEEGNAEEDDEEEDEDDEEEEEEEEDVWTAHIDPSTGAKYYFNAKRGESSWGAPPDG